MTWVSIFVRTLAIQGSWNYETLLGNGIGFCARARAAAAARRRARRRVQGGDGAPERVLQRASVSRVRRRRRARARGARRRAAGAHRALPHRALRPARQRRRPARVGGLAAVLLARRAASPSALGARPLPWSLHLSRACTTPATSALRIWGLRVGWTRGLRVAGALANPVLRQGPAYIARAAAAARRHRDPARRARASSVRAALLLGGVLGRRRADRRGRARRVCTAASKAGSSRSCSSLSSPSSRWLADGRTNRADRQQERAARAPRRGDREDRRASSRARSPSCGTSRGERQEHHGRDDARRRVRLDDRRCAPTAPTRSRRVDALAALIANKFGER